MSSPLKPTTARTTALFFAAALMLFQHPSAHAETIYSEMFDSNRGATLHGTAPQIRPGNETWVAGPAWQPDGKKSKHEGANAFLPFVPEAGQVYHLSLDMNPDFKQNDDWIALGFTQADQDLRGEFHLNPRYAVAWMLNRANDASAKAITTFVGPASGGKKEFNPDPDRPGVVKCSIQLDTRKTPWTATWLVDGEVIRDSVSFAKTPKITHVGFGARASITGAVDHFILRRGGGGLQLYLDNTPLHHEPLNKNPSFEIAGSSFKVACKKNAAGKPVELQILSLQTKHKYGPYPCRPGASFVIAGLRVELKE